MTPAPTSKQISNVHKLSILGFWIIGLCNNYSYVVILSAAYDLLDENASTNNTNSSSVCYDADSGRECNAISTGVILIANILPTLIVKVTLSWCLDYISYHLRVGICIIANLVSLLIIASTYRIPLILLGVVFASIETGLGEITFLSLTSFYGSSGVVAWSSGTGASGIVGSLSYLILTIFLSPRTAIYLMTVVPCVMGFAFWGCLYIPQFVLLKKKYSEVFRRKELERERSDDKDKLLPEEETDEKKGKESDEPNDVVFSNNGNQDARLQKDTATNTRSKFVQFLYRTLFVRHLLRYMCPLFLVYIFEYMINQGLFELLFYKNACFSQNEQYRWYQMLYQFGVFVSRSSTSLFRIKYLWLMSILQGLIFVLFYLEAAYTFIPFILITFCIVLFEGLLGGATYANAFYRVLNEVQEDRVEFSLGVVSIADSTGITLAGFLSILIHNSICRC